MAPSSSRPHANGWIPFRPTWRRLCASAKRPWPDFDLDRFLSAQSSLYDQALAELRSGQKRTHWIWFIFPQIEGLGHSSTSVYYAIKSLEEARAYLQHPLLGPRLIECAEGVLAVQGRTASDILPYPDDLKLRSSMTLFESVAESGSVFSRVLDKYFRGQRDDRTLQQIKIASRRSTAFSP